MNNPIPQIGLVGISGYGRVYLRYLEPAMARGEIRLVAAVVINPEEERDACERLESHGVILYPDWESMFEAWRGKLDLCLIPVPIHLHGKLAIAALKAGFNVLVEKPLAASLAQAMAIQEAEKQTGHWVAVGYQDTYCPSARAIRNDLIEGRIGRVRSVRWIGLWPRPQGYYTRNAWAGKLALNGSPVRDSPLNNAMAHFLNLALFWAGRAPGCAAWPKSVDAELFRCYQIESFDTAVARIRSDTGVLIQLAATHCCPTERPIHMQIIGEDGTLDWVHQAKAVWNVGGRREVMVLEDADASVHAMFGDVLGRLKSPDSPIYNTHLALSHVAAIEAIHASGRIRVVDGPLMERSGINGEAKCVIHHIEDQLNQCLQRGSLPSELGIAIGGAWQETVC